nr:MAG TPA: hypothetical protein [Caudoviricetes sp.]
MNDLTFDIEVRSFFYVLFLDVTPFLYTVIIPWHPYKFNLFLTFCSRIVNIIADIFVLHRVFV